MATISQLDAFTDNTGPVYFLSLLKGQLFNLRLHLSGNPDLATTTIVTTTERYSAALTSTGEGISISDLGEPTGTVTSNAPTVVARNQNTDPGALLMTVPRELLPDNPQPDIAENVPVFVTTIFLQGQGTLAGDLPIRVAVIYRRGP